MNKNAIVIVNISRDDQFETCRRSVEYYCKKHSIDFVCLTEKKFNIQGQDDYNYLTFEKNQVYSCFDKYDRILRLDSDIIITPDCPNLFKLVPKEEIGVVFEDVGSRKRNRHKLIKEAKKTFGKIKWRKGYFNSGVILSSKLHREIYRLTREDIELIKNGRLSRSKEQTTLNYRVRKYNFKIFPLSYKFNHMSMFSESWNKNAPRLNSFIIHYAGGQEKKPEKMKEDFRKIYLQVY